MTTVTTRRTKSKAIASDAHVAQSPSVTLHMALELDDQSWKLGFTTGIGQAPRERRVRPRDTVQILAEIRWARKRFGLPEQVDVISCYEAGREGFWLHRFLTAHGVTNHVVDSSSIEVDRRAKRAKSDRLDLRKLLRMLVRYGAGEKKVWSVVRVPSAAEEDARHLHREMATLKQERTRVVNRIHGLAATQGLRVNISDSLLTEIEGMRLWDGTAVGSGLRRRISGALDQWRFIQCAIERLDDERDTILQTTQDPTIDKIRQLLTLKAIGVNSAWVFVMEFFGWRKFNNRREIGALAGLTPTPYQSGNSLREQGISKAGNKQIRTMLIQIAWAWVRYQPQSALSLWYTERFAHGGKRMRKIGIVALSRRLLIELWRFLETGDVPEGAVLKS